MKFLPELESKKGKWESNMEKYIWMMIKITIGIKEAIKEKNETAFKLSNTEIKILNHLMSGSTSKN